MFRIETLTESRPSVLALDKSQVQELRELGRHLASDKERPGSEADSGDDEDAKATSIIRVTHLAGDQWSVKVHDAIGLVSVTDLQIEVQPKIPMPHFLYLFVRAEEPERPAATLAKASEGEPFWKLLARWFVDELELVLRRDLVRDYQHRSDDLRLIKGRLDAVSTARSYYTGVIDFRCEYDDFNQDTPLNRTLKAAARKVASIPGLDSAVQRHAVAGIHRMEDVGQFQKHDASAQTARNTSHYQTALQLARHLLNAAGRIPTSGDAYARTFLIRTPELIERAIRTVLNQHLSPIWRVRRDTKTLHPSHLEINPDLLFNDGLAVGDVKYRLTPKDWDRSVLYQTVAFASAYQTQSGVVIGFSNNTVAEPLPPVPVGDIQVSYIPWLAAGEIDPEDASERLARSVNSWLTSHTEARPSEHRMDNRSGMRPATAVALQGL